MCDHTRGAEYEAHGFTAYYCVRHDDGFMLEGISFLSLPSEADGTPFCSHNCMNDGDIWFRAAPSAAA